MMLEEQKTWRDVRLGLISLFAVSLLIAGVVFAGGDKGLLFRNTAMLKARLVDVGGLKKGSSVSIGGMIVGKVTNISFVNEANVKNQIDVTMEVRSDVRCKIKTDSVPAVRTLGMLGDRYMDISLGSEEAPTLPEGEPIMGSAATDFDATLRQTQTVLAETQKTLEAVNQKQGTVGQLFYDEKLYTNLTQFSEQLNELIKDFKKQPRKYIKFSVF